MKFYFDIDDDHYSARDENGIDLPDVDAARQHANKVVTSVACDLFNAKGAQLDANGAQLTVTMRDRTGPLYALILSLTLKQIAPPDDRRQ